MRICGRGKKNGKKNAKQIERKLKRQAIDCLFIFIFISPFLLSIFIDIKYKSMLDSCRHKCHHKHLFSFTLIAFIVCVQLVYGCCEVICPDDGFWNQIEKSFFAGLVAGGFLDVVEVFLASNQAFTEWQYFSENIKFFSQVPDS